MLVVPLGPAGALCRQKGRCPPGTHRAIFAGQAGPGAAGPGPPGPWAASGTLKEISILGSRNSGFHPRALNCPARARQLVPLKEAMAPRRRQLPGSEVILPHSVPFSTESGRPGTVLSVPTWCHPDCLRTPRITSAPGLHVLEHWSGGGKPREAIAPVE